MPVEYCKRCKTLRPMQIATSRIRVLLRGGRNSEITTRTYYCPRCRSFVLRENSKQQESSVQSRVLLPAITRSGRRTVRVPGLLRGRT